jgi:hypothetical protein
MPSWSPGGAAGLLGFCSEARWLRYAGRHLRQLFPYLPKQPGYHKRLRAAADLIQQVIRALASETTFWTDDVWVADSTPVECGRSRETPSGRRWLAGPPTATAPAIRAGSGGCGCTWSAPSQGRPGGFALSGAKADERQVLLGILAADPALVAARPGQTLIAD